MMTLPAEIRPRLGKLVRQLGSEHGGEVIATTRAIGRTLRSGGADWHSLAETVEQTAPAPAQRIPTSWHELAVWVREHGRGRLADHEAHFARDMAAKLVLGGAPSERQADWLRRLFVKLGGGRC